MTASGGAAGTEEPEQVRGSRWGRRVAAAAIAAIVLVVLAIVAAGVADMVVGCGSIDPTDSANFSRVTIQNDTRSEVVVGDCRGTYCSVPGQLTIPPDHTVQVNAACRSSGVDMTSYRVSRLDGQELGYLAVESPRKDDALVYLTSKLSHDRDTPTPPA